MTIIAVQTITKRPYGGYDDPTLPTGLWVAAVVLTGDASGGNMIAQINFSEATQLRSRESFSLEQISFISTRNGNSLVLMETSGMDNDMQRNNVGADTTQQWVIPLNVSTIASRGGAVPDQTEGLHGTFLGRQTAPNIASGLVFTLDNVNTEVLRIVAQGYVWDPRSLSSNMGLRRPVGGFYKT